MRPKRPALPGVRLNRDPVWALLDELRAGHLPERTGAPVRAFTGLPVPADGRQAQSLAAHPVAAAGAWGERLRLPVHLGTRRRSALADRQEGKAGNAKRTAYMWGARKAVATAEADALNASPSC